MTCSVGQAATCAAVLALSGCADLLGLPEGLASPSFCRSDSDCAPSQGCETSKCVARACSPAVDRPRCRGLTVEICIERDEGNIWQSAGAPCVATCSAGQCVPPPSCDFAEKCPNERSCCESIVVNGGSFLLPYRRLDVGVEQAEQDVRVVHRTVRAFALDRFEVTTDRFRKFLGDYEEHGRPEAGAGAHPAFPGSGWQAKWSNDVDGALPQTSATVQQLLGLQGQAFGLDVDPQLPVRGVTWYLAFAFCIWDGGRLPTEAEWAFAALGGDQTRTYPWSTDDSGPPIDSSRAQFDLDAGTELGAADVGTHPDGGGFFGHEDLAGNVLEWTADVYREQLTENCIEDGSESPIDGECLQQAGGSSRVERGGSFTSSATLLKNVQRWANLPSRSRPVTGFRCARDFADP